MAIAPHNFGVVVANQTYKIYRSAELGKKGIAEIRSYLGSLRMPFPHTVIYMNWEGYAFPFYYALDEYKVSVREGFTFYHPYGDPRTYLDGNNPFSPTDKIDSASKLGILARRYFEPGDNKIVGGMDAFLTILNLVLDPNNQPVLFHCLGGFHRTGMVAMAIRFIQGHEKQAIEEYHLYNPHMARQSNIDFIKAFSNTKEFDKLVTKYRALLQ